MDKQTFLEVLRHRLAELPPEEIEKSLEFYSESIDDRVEDGMTEAEAVAALGSIDEIVQSIRESMPLTAIVRARIRSDREKHGGRSVGWVVLAIVGSPVWLPLLIAFFAVALSLYVALWAVVISVAVTALALVLAGIAAAVYGILRIAAAGIGGLLLALGAGLVCAGLGLLFAAAAAILVKGAVKAAGAFGRWLKRLFLRGGAQQ